jgi:hypothetical protein
MYGRKIFHRSGICLRGSDMKAGLGSSNSLLVEEKDSPGKKRKICWGPYLPCTAQIAIKGN